MPITHNFVSAAPPVADPTKVGSVEWNEAHTVSISDTDVAAGAAIAESKLALNYPTHPSGSGTWGSITGTLSDQTDLQTALDLKLEDAPSDGTTYGRKNAAWAAVPAGGDIFGTGVVGQVAEFVTDTKHLQAAKIIGPAANILTLTNAAAATLALNVTAGKTLGLTAADDFTLTVPATGTAALLGTANIFTAAQKVNVNSTTALLVEQDGVKDNVLVVDTTNARVAINQLAAPTYAFEVQGKNIVDSPSSWTGFNLDFVNPVNNSALTLSLVDDGGSGNLSVGVYIYYVAYGTALGWTSINDNASAGTAITTNATHKQVTVTVPISADPRVTKRRIYRTKAGFSYSTPLLLVEINDNTTGTYNDNIADASLSSTNYYFQPNTTNAGITSEGVRSFLVDRNALYLGVNAGYGSGAGAALFIGTNAGYNTVSGNNLVAVGLSALHSYLTTGVLGSGNVAVGNYAGFKVGGSINAIGNVFIGTSAGYAYSVGGRNTIVGDSAGYTGVGGYINTYLGYAAGYTSTGYGNIFIGAYAGYRQTASHLFIVDAWTAARESIAIEQTNSILYGVMAATPAAQTLRINAVQTVAVDTTTTNAPLKVLDLNAYVSTAATGFANGGGVGMTWTGETATDGTSQLMASANAVWIDSTNATRKAKLSLSAYDTAARLGFEIEASGTAAKLGFFGVAPVVRPTALTTQLTTITFTAPTPDYAIQDFTQTTPWGFASHDEANTVLSVIANLQTRVGELESKLQALGLLT